MARFLGRVDDDSVHFFDPLPAGVEVHGFRPHGEVCHQMASADLNLLLLEQVEKAPWLFTGKVFEYFGAGRPILMIGPPDCPLADMVRESGLGRVCSNESALIARELTDYLEGKWTVQPNREFLARFDVRRQTAKLAEIFAKL